MDGAFRDREKGYESKWAHDEELRFKVYARRNKLLGQWAAAQLGLTGPAADDYAKQVVQADFEKPGEDDVFEKVQRDLKAKDVTVTDHTIRRMMAELLDTAAGQVQGEKR
jgi:hypothetical protein